MSKFSCLELATILPSLENQNLSLYLHFPFCLQKCDYCSFYSTPSTKIEIDKWITGILSQYNQFLLILTPKSIFTVYIGGGTPSLLTETQLRTLTHGLSSITQKHQLQFNPKEFSIEANPNSLSNEWILEAHNCGVTRMTVGVQSFSPRLRALIGRHANPDLDLKDKLLYAKSLGMRVGCDLITGIPTQTVEEAIADIDAVLDLGVSHISLYRLIIEDDSLLEKRLSDYQNEEQEDDAEFAAIARIKERGLYQYEVSNFAISGEESLHNGVYWDMGNSLGLGESAVSTLHNYDSNNIVKKAYRLTANKEIFETEEIAEKEFIFENIMMALRQEKGLSLKTFRQRFDKTPIELFPEVCQTAINNKDLICNLSTSTFKMTDKGMLFLNKFLLSLIEY